MYINQIVLQSLLQTNKKPQKTAVHLSHHHLWVLLLRTSQSFTSFFCYSSVSSDIFPHISKWFAYAAFSLSINLGISSLAAMEAVNLVLLHPRLPTSIPFLHSIFFIFLSTVLSQFLDKWTFCVPMCCFQVNIVHKWAK